MKSPTSEVIHLAVHYPRSTCGNCRVVADVPVAAPIKVEVVSAEIRQEMWTLKGRGEFGAYCPVCGAQVAIIQDLIPIQCSGLVCPKCDRPEFLTVRMKKLDTSSESFEFEAQLECKSCNRTNRLKTILKKLAGLLSIEVGLTGVTVKAKEKQA